MNRRIMSILITSKTKVLCKYHGIIMLTTCPRYSIIKVLVRLQSGQMLRTVNPPTHVFGGSNPPLTTNKFRVEPKEAFLDKYSFTFGKHEHHVMTCGDLKNGENILCRVQSECLPGILFDSAECDCKEQAETSINLIRQAGRGIYIYLMGHEGRGHGITHKVKALAYKQKGFDTFTAIEALNADEAPGTPLDVRDWSMVKPILDYFGIKSIACLTNSPDKVKILQGAGVVIASTINIPVTPNEISKRHLLAKRARGHNMVFTSDLNK